MAEIDDDVIPIGIPPVPGKPEASARIAEAMNTVIDQLEGQGDLAAASIFFTVGLCMAQGAGVSADGIRALLDAELARTMGAGPRREPRRALPGRTRRVRCH